MDRRAFLGTLRGGLSARRGAGRGEGARRPRIGLLFANTPEAEIKGGLPVSPYPRVVLVRMRELGWVDGQNITIERKSAEGRFERFPSLATELLSLPVDLIVMTAPTSAVQQMKQVAGEIPIVVAGGDPDGLVRLGLANSLGRPGGTVTGLTTSTESPELESKRLQVLKESVPKVARVAYLGASSPLPPVVEATAHALSVKLLPVELTSPEDFDTAFAAIRRGRVDALLVGRTGFFWGHRRRITDFAARERLPAVYGNRIFAESGGLVAYGTDYVDIYRRAAAYVDKILKGVKPGEIPIEQPTKFELVISVKTAKALGLTIPPSLLARADQVIE